MDKAGRKKIKKENKVEKLFAKFQGPFVHINGDFDSPLKVQVINSVLDNLDSSNKTNNSRTNDGKETRRHQSAPSGQYEHKTLTGPWACVFCNQATHWNGLGDLFGPYWVPSSKIITQRKSPEPINPKASPEDENDNSEQVDDPTEDCGKSSENFSDVCEIWFHEDCLCWVPCVYLVGSQVVGLEEAVELSRATVCCSCGERGASVGCCEPRCRQKAHVGCATREGWALHVDTFKAACTGH